MLILNSGGRKDVHVGKIQLLLHETAGEYSVVTRPKSHTNNDGRWSIFSSSSSNPTLLLLLLSGLSSSSFLLLLSFLPPLLHLRIYSYLLQLLLLLEKESAGYEVLTTRNERRSSHRQDCIGGVSTAPRFCSQKLLLS